MQHDQVIEENLVEQYLLDEMSATERDAFEEHFFECRECADDVRATAAFMEIAREELKHASPAAVAAAAPTRRPEPMHESTVRRWWASLWNPGFAFAMAALCLMVTGYQNLVTYPRLASQVARLDAPTVLPMLSLAGSASRGGAVPSAPASGPLSLGIDIPSRPEFSSYVCRFYSSAHQLLFAVPVSPEQAKDTVQIRIPADVWGPGQYAVEVQALNVSGAATDVARYTFVLNSGPSSSGH
jgi:hypothetical protein